MRNSCSHSFRETKGSSLDLSDLSTLNPVSPKCKPLFMQFCNMQLDISLHPSFTGKGGEDDYINNFVRTLCLHIIQLFQDEVLYTCSDAEASTFRVRQLPTNPNHIVSLGGFLYLTAFMLGSINIIFLYSTTHHHYTS